MTIAAPTKNGGTTLPNISTASTKEPLSGKPTTIARSPISKSLIQLYVDGIPTVEQRSSDNLERLAAGALRLGRRQDPSLRPKRHHSLDRTLPAARPQPHGPQE